VKIFARIVLNIFFGLFYRVKIVDIDNVPETGGAVLCANHLGGLDMFFIGYRLKRLVHWMAKEELFRNPLISAVIRKLGAFPIKRGKVDVESIKMAYKLLEEGKIVGIFPQGTRTRNKDITKIKIGRGAAVIAVNAGVPIIPVALSGSYKPFSKVKVVFGKPFYIENKNGKEYTNDEMREISKGIMEKIYALLEEK